MVKTLPIAELFFCCKTINMFLRSYKRKKNGKWHEYFSVVENRRVANGKTVQRTVLYLGEITSSQEDTWKKTLQVFPVYHQLEHRVEAHIFVAFLAYCLMITLRQKLRYHAPGLTARDVLDKLSGIVMIDVRIPTTDGRMLEMRRYSQPELEHRIILDKFKVKLPKQPPPKVYSHQLKR